MRAYWAVPLALSLLASPTIARAENDEILGAWTPTSYILKDGTEHDVDGLIFFTSTDWTVLFFVQDGAGEPRRGSGEGGSYTLEGDQLTFRHHYHLSAGEAMDGLAEAPLRMNIASASEAAVEPSRIEIAGDRLTIAFPSGNRILFERSSE